MQGRHMVQPVNIRHSVPVQGIPTTRAGSIVTSDTMIVRDPLYTGDPIEERASVVLRIAPSFFRFGSFEIFNHTDIKTGRHTHSGTPAHGPGSPPAVTPTALSSFVVQRSEIILLDDQHVLSWMPSTMHAQRATVHAREPIRWSPSDCMHAGRSGPSAGKGLEHTMLPEMLDHIIRTFFPHIWKAPVGTLREVRMHF